MPHLVLIGPGGALSIMSMTRRPSPIGDLGERILDRLAGSRIAVPVERHVGQAVMRRDRRRLAFRALERRHIGRRSSLLVRRDIGFGDIELAHGTPSDYFGLTVAHGACVFQSAISCGNHRTGGAHG